MLSLVHDADAPAHEDRGLVDLDELCRLAARDMIAIALEAERRAYLEAHAGEVDATGRRLVVGNGYARERQVVTGAGAVEVTAPRVDDRRAGQRFASAILPPYMRRSPKVTEVLPILYLRGLSTSDFASALAGFFGTDAGLSASTVARLTQAWQAEHTEWSRRDLSDRDYVYIWCDGVHFNIRLEEDRLCCLVIVGVRPDGTKELVAVADGYRESTEAWADLLRDLRDRGMTDPEVAVGDGALGLWAALREVFPTTGAQRCWVHKTANVVSALPSRMHEDAKTALAAIWGADTRAGALDAAAAFAEQFDAWPKATAKVLEDLDALTCFFDYPAEHWIHLRTTNPIESAFATVRLRQRVTKGAGSREAGLAMAFKLLEAAEDRWRRVNAPHLVTVVRAGGRFIDGQLQERNKTDENTSVEECAA